MLPANVGVTCFQPIRTLPGYARPLHVANTVLPADPRLDPPGASATGIPGSALPGIVLHIPENTFTPGARLTIQGLIGDRNARTIQPLSVTNAVIVAVE